MRTESSAALLRCSSRSHSLALATGLAGSSQLLRSWRLFPEGSSRIAIHQTGFEGGPASSCPCSAEPPAASSSLQSSSLQGIPPPPQGLPPIPFPSLPFPSLLPPFPFFSSSVRFSVFSSLGACRVPLKLNIKERLFCSWVRKKKV